MHRTYLYTPGDRPDRMAKAHGLAVDALILDLEDGDAPSAKSAARREVVSFVESCPADGPALLVRVNPLALVEDLAALSSVLGRIDAVYLAKATVGLLDELDDLLGEAPTEVIGLIESAQGVLDAPEIARHPRIRNLAMGEADLGAELGIDASADFSEFLPLRMSVVVASAAAEIDPPTAPVSTQFRDLDAFRADTESLRRMGFGARSCIHPDQLAVAAEVFTPGAADVESARELVAAFEAAVARGEGVFVGPDGRMVDEAVVRHARRLLG